MRGRRVGAGAAAVLVAAVLAGCASAPRSRPTGQATRQVPAGVTPTPSFSSAGPPRVTADVPVPDATGSSYQADEAPDGSVWLADTLVTGDGDKAVVVVPPDGQPSVRLHVPRAVTALAVDDASVWVSAPGETRRYDRRDGRQLESWSFGGGAVDAAGGHALVLDQPPGRPGQLVALTAGADQVTPVAVELRGTENVVATAAAAYALDTSGRLLVRVTPDGEATTARVDLPIGSRVVGVSARSVVVAAVPDQDNGPRRTRRLLTYDPQTLAQTSDVATDQRFLPAALTDTAVWGFGSCTPGTSPGDPKAPACLARLDPATGAASDVIQLPGRPASSDLLGPALAALVTEGTPAATHLVRVG